MKVFVAGSTGAIGRILVPQLVEKGHEVVALVRNDRKAEALLAVGAKPPYQISIWLGKPAIGESVVSMMTQIRGGSNAKAKRELGWEPTYQT